MALTRDYKETVVARVRRDRKFARALYAEALSALMEGETAEGLSMLRDLVHAQITFKELARQTGLGDKTLHRMLNRNGNPTARNLGVIVKKIAEDYRVSTRNHRRDANELIKELQADEELRAVPMMLVSNYEDSQAEAVKHGAKPGFGKAALGQPRMLSRVKPLLE